MGSTLGILIPELRGFLQCFNLVKLGSQLEFGSVVETSLGPWVDHCELQPMESAIQMEEIELLGRFRRHKQQRHKPSCLGLSVGILSEVVLSTG